MEAKEAQEAAIKYNGRRVNGTCFVLVVADNGHRHDLPLYLRIVNHSPTGFEWGYGGSGQAQLALAILAHATKDHDLAQRLHQRYKWDVIARLDRDASWVISKEDVLAWVAATGADKVEAQCDDHLEGWANGTTQPGSGMPEG
jgi:hypothetical protein